MTRMRLAICVSIAFGVTLAACSSSPAALRTKTSAARSTASIPSTTIVTYGTPSSFPATTVPVTTVPPTTFPPTTTTSPAEALTAWIALTDPDTELVETDTQNIETDSSDEDIDGLGTDCADLHADVGTLQRGTPAPVASVNEPYQAYLSDLAASASACTAGVDDFKNGDLTESTSELGNSDAEVSAASNELGQENRAIEVVCPTCST